MKPTLYALAGALAAVLITTTSALAGNGVGGVFNLGEVNTVNAQTTLSGNAGANPQLRVENAATVQNAFGVLGRITAGSPAAQTAGVRGINSGTNANGFGVWGFHQGSGVGVFGETGAGTGVLGKHTGPAGTTPGVQGETSSTAVGAVGVFGTVSAATPGVGSAGVRGTNAGAEGYGVFGENTGTGNSVGVFGKSAGRAGILGTGETTGGTLFSPDTGVYACAKPAGTVCNTRPSFTGLGIGGYFEGKGVRGIGAYGCGGNSCSMSFALNPLHPFGGQFSASGEGAVGVLGNVRGTDAIGVEGRASDSGGIGGRFNGGSLGVLGQSSTGLAGKFEGHLHTTGRITKAYTSGTSSQAVPIAYGTVRATDGLLLSGTPNVSGSYDATNHRYVVTIANETYATASYITTVTPTTSAQPRFATTSASSGKLLVRIFDADGGLQQAQFSFVTYKV
jgi:hypothetical protein